MTFAEKFLAEFDAEAATTRKMFERVPDAQLSWKPHEKSMSLGRLAGHTAEMPGWMVNTIELDSYGADPSTYKAFEASSQKELIDTFQRYAAEARKALTGVTDDHLQKTWTLTVAGRQIFSTPRYAVLQSFLLNHMIHHRGQLSVYLRLLDIPVPGMYGPTADEI